MWFSKFIELWEREREREREMAPQSFVWLWWYVWSVKSLKLIMLGRWEWEHKSLFYFFRQRKWSLSKKYMIELARSFGVDWFSPILSRAIKGLFGFKINGVSTFHFLYFIYRKKHLFSHLVVFGKLFWIHNLQGRSQKFLFGGVKLQH